MTFLTENDNIIVYYNKNTIVPILNFLKLNCDIELNKFFNFLKIIKDF